MAASVLTSLCCGMRLERYGWSLQEDMTKLILFVTNADAIREANLDGTLITKDR